MKIIMSALPVSGIGYEDENKNISRKILHIKKCSKVMYHDNEAGALSCGAGEGFLAA